MVCSSTTGKTEKNHSPVFPANLIVSQMTSQLWADFNKVWFPLQCICIFANTGPFLFAPTKADSAVGEGSHCPSVRLTACCGDWCPKKKEKSYYCLKKILWPLTMPNLRESQWITVKSTFTEAERVGSPTFRFSQSHLYIPVRRDEHANPFHRFLELHGKTELDFQRRQRGDIFRT